MPFQPRRLASGPVVSAACLFVLMSLPAWAADKMRLRVDDYQIDAELTPHTHKIAARAKVKFTALEDLSIATFELHNALRVTKVLDAAGKPLSAERVTQDSTVRVPLTTPLAKDTSTTLTFEYEGVLDSADDSPVQGLKLASIGDDTSYLLYAGRWFPVNAYGINRFTATMNITVPAHMMVIGSGKETAGSCPGDKTAGTGALPTKTLHLRLGQAQFSRNHRRRNFSGIQKRRGRAGSARLLQAGPSESGSDLRHHRGQGIHLLRDAVRSGAFDHAESGRDSG